MANSGPTVEIIIHPATNEANVGPTVVLIIHPATNKVNVGLTVEPIFHPATNEANVGQTDTDYPDIINLFNNNTPISMLQFSPYAINDDFEESFGDEVNGIIIPETQMNNLESDDDEGNGTVIPEIQMNNLESNYNNQQMLDEGCMICKRDDNHDILLLCEGCNGEYHT